MYKFLLSLLILPIFAFAHQETPGNPDLFNKDKAAFLIGGEFLYWTVSEGALDYAIRMRKPSWGPSDSYAQGNIERGEFDWDSGYRFTFGYYRAPNFWEADFQWTYIHVNGNDRAKRPTNDENRFITGTFPQIFQTPVDHTTSHIHLHYKLADLMANRVFHPFDNPHLRLKLLGGLTGLWVHQGWNACYFDATINQTTISNRWKYWGFGFRGGLSADWFIGKDFYLVGKMSAALVVGHYKNWAKQTTNMPLEAGDNPAVPVRDVRYTDYRLCYTTQFLLGPSYQRSFSAWRFELFAGYEMTIWTNLQEVFRSTSGPADQAKETWINDGLVALHGLTVRGTVNF